MTEDPPLQFFVFAPFKAKKMNKDKKSLHI